MKSFHNEQTEPHTIASLARRLNLNRKTCQKLIDARALVPVSVNEGGGNGRLYIFQALDLDRVRKQYFEILIEKISEMNLSDQEKIQLRISGIRNATREED